MKVHAWRSYVITELDRRSIPDAASRRLTGHVARDRSWHRGCLLIPRTMRFALLVLLASTPALAGHELVRDDIVDLRHDRWPNRRVFLGWTADNRAVIHVVSCGTYDGSDAPFCSSSLEVFGATKRSGRDGTDQLTPLLDPTCRHCGPGRRCRL